MDKNKKKQVGVSISPEVLEAIDSLAKELNLSRSQMFENLILMSLDDVKLLKKLGLFELGIKLRGFRDFMLYKFGGVDFVNE